ncbi:MAG: lamin tail domain-containing protein [Deltaproteobacteria bacterium]|nr:MAG: lamin tail domain-containing protein [Deltaproteobacteria bacterium]
MTQAEACAGRMCGDVDDGCGGTLTCGDCGAGQVCDVDAFGGGTGTCVDCLTCEEYGAMVGGQACGMPAATCGVDCGTCMASGEGCSDGSIAPANVCVACTTCADLGGPGVACGTPPDGCGGTLMCGDCGAGQVCDVDGRFGGPPNRCVTCRTCADIAGGGQACGMADNGCGEILSCGDCTGGQVCGDGVVGPPNVCVDPPAGPTAAGDVVITEIMRDPKVVVDADGEWFELYNPTTTAFDLEGCTISDDGMDSHVIDTGGAGLIIGAGGTLVLGNNMNYDTNGHVPVSYQYDGVTLANSSDELVISCGGTEIARVNYGTGFPTVAGASMNLDKFVLDETANDSAANWCPTLQQINGDPALDRGTPSMENEACPVANCTLSMEDSATCPAADFSDPANAPCGVILLLAGLPCPATPTGNCGGSGDALGGVSILEFARPVTVVDVVFATEVTGASATMTFYDAFGTPVGEVTANGACDGLSSPATSQHVVLAGPAVSAQVTGPAWIDDLVINPPM